MQVHDRFTWNIPNCAHKRSNNPLLPKSIRGLIIGKSNCGKTTLLLNLLLRKDWLDYNRLYVFGKSLHQKEYKILREGFKAGLSKQQISNIFSNQNVIAEKQLDVLNLIKSYSDLNYSSLAENSDVQASFYTDCSTQIPDPSELDENFKNLLILDDCLLEKQTKAEAYYTRGRHNNCDTFYISQNYFRLPRQTIRENSNLILLFPQDSKNLNHIYADHCAMDMKMDEFKSFCHDSWAADTYNFITIDLSSSKNNGKYRMNFDTFYFPESTIHIN